MNQKIVIVYNLKRNIGQKFGLELLKFLSEIWSTF